MLNKEEIKENLLSTISVIFNNPKLKELNEEQKECIEKNFNTHIDFEYVEDGGYTFIMEEYDFKNFEYYLGMEYEKQYIESKIVIDDIVIVTYSYDSNRTKDLIDMLNEIEE